jgi:hypothetical protein
MGVAPGMLGCKFHHCKPLSGRTCHIVKLDHHLPIYAVDHNHAIAYGHFIFRVLGKQKQLVDLADLEVAHSEDLFI